MIYSGDACAPPDLHWLDLPLDPDEDYEEEEQTPERKPICAFTDKQTLLVHRPPKKQCHFTLMGFEEIHIPDRLLEFPMPGDEVYLGQTFQAYGGLIEEKPYGYILQRNPEFKPAIYGWAAQR